MEQLDELLRRLRKPDGCPWDRAQTSRSLAPFLLEEAYEVSDAIHRSDETRLREELGDLLLHVVFQAQLAEDRGSFDLADVVQGITLKMRNRHKHVLEDTETSEGETVTWEEIKRREKGRASLLDGIPNALPALLMAWRTQQRAAEVGFDWTSARDVWDKVKEEISEVEAEVEGGDSDRIAAELGDLLFALVSYIRHHGREAEEVLRSANERFRSRFKKMEELLSKRGTPVGSVTLEAMDDAWNEIKEQERATSMDGTTDSQSMQDNRRE